MPSAVRHAMGVEEYQQACVIFKSRQFIVQTNYLEVKTNERPYVLSAT
jgi:hypothetical protein